MVSIIHKPVTKPLSDKNNGTERDVTKTGKGERGVGNGERKSGNELSAETSTKIQNGGPKNETSS